MFNDASESFNWIIFATVITKFVYLKQIYKGVRVKKNKITH